MIHFTKMQALGNDFVIINKFDSNFDPKPSIIRQLSDRHTGIGFDQLLIVGKKLDQNADFHCRILMRMAAKSINVEMVYVAWRYFLKKENLIKRSKFVLSTKKDLIELND